MYLSAAIYPHRKEKEYGVILTLNFKKTMSPCLVAVIAQLAVSSACFFFFCLVTREECILLSAMSAQREKSSHRRIEGKEGGGHTVL